VIHPIPSGTRDVLPDEMRELRAITEALRGVFDARGYGEVYTPALEYASELEPAGAPPAYRLFDEHGEPMVLRTDMTVPIARVVATRYADAEPPLRFSYFAHAYRAVRPQRGQPREFLQGGVELVGAPAPDGTVEALRVLCESLSAVGLRDFRVGLGDASLYPALLDGHGVASDARARILHELATRDFVGLERELTAAGLPAELLAIPQTRGPDLPDDEGGPLGEALAGMRAVRDGLPGDVAERVIFDLGLSRGLGYYTGAIFEVYDPALGAPIGGGGRYDHLLGRFGRALPAVGFAFNVERVHLALTGEEERS
jgi:ATP phosphoribosyltransferase regulatory subunit